MKKFDMSTRAGRNRRKNETGQFNPDTLKPHTKSFLEERRRKDDEYAKKVKERKEFRARLMREKAAGRL